jgi:hypothetical protein
MFKTEVRPLEGFEEDFARYMSRKDNVCEEIEAERVKAHAEVDAKFDAEKQSRTATLEKLIALTSETIEIEIPEEVPTEIAEVEVNATEESF